MPGLFGPYPNSSGSTPVPVVSATPGIIKRTAGASLPAHRAVYVHSDNRLHLADLVAVPYAATGICGITPGAYTIGSDAYARFSGELSDPSFSFVDGPIYLGVNGTLTQTSPISGPVIVLGHAIGPNAMIVQVSLPANQTSVVGTSDAQIFYQPTPSATWTITHSFSRIPNVTVYDSTGRQVFPDVTALDSVTICIEFNGASDGTAILT